MQECRPAHFILVSSCALAVLLMPGMYMSHELSCCSMICFQERRVHVGLAAICSTIFSNCFPAQHTYTYKIRQDKSVGRSPCDTIRYDTIQQLASKSVVPLLLSTVFMAKLASVSVMPKLRTGPSRPGVTNRLPSRRTLDEDEEGENEPPDDDEDNGMVAEEYAAAIRRPPADRCCG